MDTQGLQPDTPDSRVTEHGHSKKMVPLIAGAAVLVILAAIGVYYVAFRSLPTTVSWAPSVSAIAPGGELTVSDRVTPAESGRLVSFESASSAQGPWQPMPQSKGWRNGETRWVSYLGCSSCDCSRGRGSGSGVQDEVEDHVATTPSEIRAKLRAEVETQLKGAETSALSAAEPARR